MTFHHCPKCDGVHDNVIGSCPTERTPPPSKGRPPEGDTGPGEDQPRAGSVSPPPVWALERAAQLWCRPELRTTVMDPVLATAIAEALVEVQEQGKRQLDDARAAVEQEARRADLAEAQRDAAQRDLEARKRTRLLDLRSLLEVTGSRWQIGDDGSLIPPVQGEQCAWHCGTCGAEVLVVPQGDELVLPPGWVSGAPSADEMRRVYCSAKCRTAAEGNPS